MTAPRRSSRLVPSLAPLMPQSCDAPSTTVRKTKPAEREMIETIAVWKRMLYHERRRHAQLEAVLAKYIASLESQIADMRTAYIATLAAQLKGKN